MASHVALLRGVNVGGNSKVALAELRSLVASLGHVDVATYIQSGNVLLTPVGTDLATVATEMEHAIAQVLGVTTRVALLSREDLASVIAANPFPEESNPKNLHAIFLVEAPEPGLAEAVAAAKARAAEKGSRDQARLLGRTVYVRTFDGYGRSELASELARGSAGQTLRRIGTARNWTTVTKLLDLCDR